MNFLYAIPFDCSHFSVDAMAAFESVVAADGVDECSSNRNEAIAMPPSAILQKKSRRGIKVEYETSNVNEGQQTNLFSKSILETTMLLIAS